MFALLRRLPSFLINGIAVAVGIGATRVLLGTLADPHFADLALTGAIYTSLADVPARPGRTAQRVFAGALTGLCAAVLIALLHPHPAAVAFGIAFIVFTATMMLGWGARAGPVSFAAVLAVVFTMSLPPGHGVREVLLSHAAGAAVYIVWAVAASAALQGRYRTLALATAIDATAGLLRARAAAVAQTASSEQALEASRGWIAAESRLAERLQAARNLLFPERPTPLVVRQTAILLRLIDLRDVVLASSVDLPRLGDAALRQDLRRRLLEAAEALEACRGLVAGTAARAAAVPDAGGSETPAAAGDAAELAARRRQLADDVQHIARLAQGEDEALPRSAAELRRFVAPEGWPLRDLVAQAKLASPVFRHALRAAAALTAAYLIAQALPWSAHPQWLVLSVAVVLRGNLEQTLARRNARVLGTLLGCLVVVLLAHAGSGPVATAAFLVAIGLAHGFALEQYLVTACAGTVMALLQAHAVAPTTGFPIAERLADTLIGAVLAWAFSFVLPSWERRGLPRAVEQALKALAEYTRLVVPGGDADNVAQGLARRHAYDALGALTVSLQRIAAEPTAVRPPPPALEALLRFVDQAQRLMAQVSMLRQMGGGDAGADEPLEPHLASLRRNETAAAEAAHDALRSLAGRASNV